MSIKKLFTKEKNQQVLAAKTSKAHGKDVESERLVEAKAQQKSKFLTHVRYHPASASNFAIYGSAKKYYADALHRISEQYPYDGTLAEKTQWELGSSQLDLYVFNDLYPRTNGYAQLCSTTSGWGTLNGSITSDYGLPSTIEYIQFRGGPHTGSGETLLEQFQTHKPGVGSNVYETYNELTASEGTTDIGSRESNLKTNLEDGVTVEFWLKKPAFSTSKTVKEVIFDLWNGNTLGAGDYGRLLIELKGDASASPFRITCASGSSGFTRQTIGSNLTLSSVQDWAHYALTFKNLGSSIRTRLYVDGALNEEVQLGSDISEITGSMIANIGALRTSPVTGVSLTEGAGKLSGSLDEFRFWKTERDHKEIGRYYWQQVNGGSNVDVANTNLGVYYKFNEGTVGIPTIDKTVLDYSGRISNGHWVGYPGSTARATGSAIIEASAAPSEFLDPIIYTNHPEVKDLTSNLSVSGSVWDDSNSSVLYQTLPAWIMEYQENTKQKDLENLIQIIASEFDKLHLQVANLNRLKNVTYPSASLKPLPFAKSLIENYGMPAGEVFANAEILEKILSKSETLSFESELSDTKNLIYRNIYNNLVDIYKAKGTEKSFRNLIRCFGVDDELIKLNLYGDNVTYELENNYKAVAKIRKYANFNHTDFFNSTVYQYAESGNVNAISYLTGSDSNDKEAHFGATLETEVYFPKKIEVGNPGYFETSFTEVSLFGMHTVGAVASSYAFPTPDPAGFNIMAVKSERESPHVYFKLSPSATSALPELTSDTFLDVYNNEKWNFAIRIKPDDYPRTDGIYTGKSHQATATISAAGSWPYMDNGSNITLKNAYGESIVITLSNATATSNDGVIGGDGVSTAALMVRRIAQAINATTDTMVAAPIDGSADSITITQTTRGSTGNQAITTTNTDSSLTVASEFTGGTSESYTLEFRGVNNTLDVTHREFSITASLSEIDARNFLSSSKRVFIGAHRTDFTDTVINYSDVEVGAVRYWPIYIDDYTFKAHIKDIENYGSKHPYKNVTLLHSETENIQVPQIKTLALNWDFDTLTKADSSGQFTVPDASSGSIARDEYGWIAAYPKYQHTGRGNFYPADSATAIRERYINSAKQQLPEIINSSDMIEIRREDDNQFTREHRPIKYFYGIEKSMYQTISEEMLNMFATIVDFNNIIGEPKNRYRQEYKAMEKLRQLFFERVSNTPDLDKYVDFYKWIDHNISEILLSLVPASANSSDGIQTMVESHILERNKYWNKFPTLEMKSDPPIAGLRGINELLYNWRFSHAPVSDSTNQFKNCPWWYERIERTHDSVSSGVAEVDDARETIRKVTGRHRDEYRKVAHGPAAARTNYSGSAFAVSRFTKPYRMILDKSEAIHGGTNYVPTKNLDIARVSTYPQGFDNDAGFPVNVVLFDDIYVNKSAKHVIDADPVRRVSGRREPLCTDGIEGEWPHNKYRYDYKARLLRDFGDGEVHSGSHPPEYYTTMKGEYVAPFSLYYTTLTDTFHGYIQERFHSNLTITNLHADSYGNDNEEPMQGPFTYTHVGGRQNRHVDLNTGIDNYENRAEAWKILIGPTSAAAAEAAFETDKTCDETPDFTPDPHMLGLVGPDYPWPPMGPWPGEGDTCGTGLRPIDRPRATFLRNAGTKRPLNIENIKYGTGSVSLGNYQRDYEIVHTAGRHINNTALVEAEGFNVTGSDSIIYAADEFLKDISGYNLPSRTKRSHVMVSRFSAPGAPNQAGGPDGGFGLDLESGQFSVYNTMNYRNSQVRGQGRWPNGVRELLSDHTNQFGYFSDQMNISNSGSVRGGPAAENIMSSSVNPLDYKGRGNFHKTNRNTAHRLDFRTPICFTTSSDFNKKAAQWERSSGTCGFKDAYITIPMRNFSRSGKNIQAQNVTFTDIITTDAQGNTFLTNNANTSTNDPNNLLTANKAPTAANATANERVAATRAAVNARAIFGIGLTTVKDPGLQAVAKKLRKPLRVTNRTKFTNNALGRAYSMSIWAHPCETTTALSESSGCNRALMSLGSDTMKKLSGGNLQLPGAGTVAAGASQVAKINPPAKRVVYLNTDNQVVVEVNYIIRTEADPNAVDANGNQVKSVRSFVHHCGIWRTEESVNLNEWTNIVVTHDTLEIMSNGNPSGPEIYFDGTPANIVVMTQPPVNSVPIPPTGPLLIGKVTTCAQSTFSFCGRLDEFSLWPLKIDANQVLEIAGSPQPKNLENHTIFGAIAIWLRMGDGRSPDGQYPDAIDNTGVTSVTNRIWDMSPSTGRHNGNPSENLGQAFTDVSSGQSTANLRLPGEHLVEEVCQYNTGSFYDNWYVTHEIPRSDTQYLWISGSSQKDVYGTTLDENGQAVFGHLHPSGRVPAFPQTSTGSAYVPAIDFITASNFGSFVTTVSGITKRKWGARVGPADGIPDAISANTMATPFNLNVHTYEPITASADTLGYPLNDGSKPTKGAYFFEANNSLASPGGLTSQIVYLNNTLVNGGISTDVGRAALFNTIILARQGPFGWPSWKQIRGAEHPLVVEQRKTNTLAIADAPKEHTITTVVAAPPNLLPGVSGADIDDIAGQANNALLKRTVRGLSHGNSVTRYTERPIVYNCPMTHIVSGRTVLRHTYRNNMCMYSNQEINNRFNLSEDRPSMYSTLVEKYTMGWSGKTPALTFNYLAYCEGIYPKEVNRYSNAARMREHFQFDWHSTREKRGATWNQTLWSRANGTTQLIPGRFIIHPQSLSPLYNSQIAPGYTSPTVGLETHNSHINNKFAYSTWPLDSTAPSLDAGEKIVFETNQYPIAHFLRASSTIPGLGSPAQNQDTHSSGSGELQNYHVQLRGKYINAAAASATVYDTLAPAAQYHRRHTIGTTGSACQWRYGVRGVGGALKMAAIGAVGTSPRGKWLATGADTLIDPETLVGTMSGSSLDWFCDTAKLAGHAQFAGGETNWEVPEQSGKVPFYDSYEDFASEDLRLKAKDCTIVPEFRISEHIPYYMLEKGGDFLAGNPKTFSLTGSSIADSSNDEFYKVYSNTEFMKKFDIVDKDHEALGGPRRIELKCKAYLKLLPYDGFYPAQRTVQLASLFSQSFGPSLYRIQEKTPRQAVATAENHGMDPGLNTSLGTAYGDRNRISHWAMYLRPFFAPGIMFNSIKSGIAVDYPIMTGSYAIMEDPRMLRPTTSQTLASTPAAVNRGAAVPLTQMSQSGWYISEPRFHHRIPFEAIINPSRYLPDLPITNMEPHPSGSLNLPMTASVHGQHNDLYRMAANNFFAEVPEFFLENGSLSAMASLPDNHPQFGIVTRSDIVKDRKFAALVKIRKSVKREQNFNRLSSSGPNTNTGGSYLTWAHRTGQVNVERLGTNKPLPTPWSLSEPTINMYSRPSAFGPPTIGLWGSNAGFNLPYTPPYYDGGAWAYIEFTPTAGAKKYTLDEILEDTEITYTRAGKQWVRRDPQRNKEALQGDNWFGPAAGMVPNWPWSRPMEWDGGDQLQALNKNLITADGSIIAKVNEAFDPLPQGRDLIDDNAMQISASINLMQIARIKSAEYNAITGRPVSVSDAPHPQSNLNAWVIQTKFETPILNFQKSSSAGRTYAKETSAYGMWHQYGEYPTQDNVGVFMEIVDVPKAFLYRGLGKNAEQTDNMGSLADLVGFSGKPVKLGTPAQKKVISEGVVAVPFIEKDGERHFFEIQRVTINEAVNRVSGNPPRSSVFGPNFSPGESIVDMVEKMQKFVFPPKMDFVTNQNIQPFAMYVFEFSTELDREDVTDIWQNVLPKIGKSFEEQTITVAHELNPTEFMGCDSVITGKKLQDKLQWMVFKVKQRAQKSYFDKVVGRNQLQDGANRTLLENYVMARQGTQSKLVPLDYTYNWPYDYFSLVELAKIDSTIEYGEDPFEIVKRVEKSTQMQTAPPGIAPTLGGVGANPEDDEEAEPGVPTGTGPGGTYGG